MPDFYPIDCNWSRSLHDDEEEDHDDGNEEEEKEEEDLVSQNHWLDALTYYKT